MAIDSTNRALPPPPVPSNQAPPPYANMPLSPPDETYQTLPGPSADSIYARESVNF